MYEHRFGQFGLGGLLVRGRTEPLRRRAKPLLGALAIAGGLATIAIIFAIIWGLKSLGSPAIKAAFSVVPGLEIAAMFITIIAVSLTTLFLLHALLEDGTSTYDPLGATTPTQNPRTQHARSPAGSGPTAGPAATVVVREHVDAEAAPLVEAHAASSAQVPTGKSA